MCRWVGDPVIARAQHSSSSQHSKLGPAGAQTSDDVSQGHNAEPGCISDFKLLHACKLGNSREAEQIARQAMMLSNKSDVHVARNIRMLMAMDSEGVSCLHAIAQSPSPGKTAWTSDDSFQTLSTNSYAPLCAYVSSMQPCHTSTSFICCFHITPSISLL